MSGFYEEDLPVISDKAEKCGLKRKRTSVENKWMAVEFTKDQEY
jgi:hypothetical protein